MNPDTWDADRRAKIRAAREGGYDQWDAVSRAFTALDRIGLAGADEEDIMSNSGAQWVAQSVPAAPVLAAGQRTTAYILARVDQALQLVERDDLEPTALARLIGELRALVASERGRIDPQAWTAAEAAIAAERAGRWNSGSM